MILALVILLLCSLLIFSSSNLRKIKTSNLFFWPGLRNLLIMYAYGLVFALIFYSLFGGADLITKQHGYRFDLGFSFEDEIPFLPYFSIVYLSGGLALLLVPFVLPKDRLFVPFLKLITLELAVATLLFILFPLTLLEYPDLPEDNWLGKLFAFNATANLDFNYFPSLHVAFALTFALFASEGKQTWLKILLLVWVVAVAASTLLTKQHYFVDVIGGAILALICYKLKRKINNGSD